MPENFPQSSRVSPVVTAQVIAPAALSTSCPIQGDIVSKTTSPAMQFCPAFGGGMISALSNSQLSGLAPATPVGTPLPSAVDSEVTGLTDGMACLDSSRSTMDTSDVVQSGVDQDGLDPRNYMVARLHPSIKDKDLAELFAPFGTLSRAVIIMDTGAGRSRGFGFVTFTEEAAGEAALAAMDGKEIFGRKIRMVRSAKCNVVTESSSVWVRNSPVTVTSDQLTAIFGAYGTIVSLKTKLEWATRNKRHNKFHFVRVEYESIAVARSVIKALHGAKMLPLSSNGQNELELPLPLVVRFYCEDRDKQSLSSQWPAQGVVVPTAMNNNKMNFTASQETLPMPMGSVAPPVYHQGPTAADNSGMAFFVGSGMSPLGVASNGPTPFPTSSSSAPTPMMQAAVLPFPQGHATTTAQPISGQQQAIAPTSPTRSSPPSFFAHPAQQFPTHPSAYAPATVTAMPMPPQDQQQQQQQQHAQVMQYYAAPQPQQYYSAMPMATAPLSQSGQAQPQMVLVQIPTGHMPPTC